MKHVGLLLFSSALALSLVAPPKAAATTILNPGDVLQVTFSVTNPICPGGPCDVLTAIPSAGEHFYVVADGAALFDGSTLLGFHHTGNNYANFRAPSSLFTTLDSVTVNFSSIYDSSIQGLITFSIASGHMTWWWGEPGMFLTLGHALETGGALAGTGLTITSSTIVSQVPEPASAWLCVGGIGLLLWLRGREKTRRN